MHEDHGADGRVATGTPGAAPGVAVGVAAIFAAGSGQQRVNELFRRAQRMRVSRTVVATVAVQDDYMKRVRGGGGARAPGRGRGLRDIAVSPPAPAARPRRRPWPQRS